MPSWHPLACLERRASGRSVLGGQNRGFIGHAYDNGHENPGLPIKREFSHVVFGVMYVTVFKLGQSEPERQISQIASSE